MYSEKATKYMNFTKYLNQMVHTRYHIKKVLIVKKQDLFWDCTHKQAVIIKTGFTCIKKGFSSAKKTKEKKSFSSNRIFIAILLTFGFVFTLVLMCTLCARKSHYCGVPNQEHLSKALINIDWYKKKVQGQLFPN